MHEDFPGNTQAKCRTNKRPPAKRLKMQILQAHDAQNTQWLHRERYITSHADLAWMHEKHRSSSYSLAWTRLAGVEPSLERCFKATSQ